MKTFWTLAFFFLSVNLPAQSTLSKTSKCLSPLDEIVVGHPKARLLTVTDASGRVYVSKTFSGYTKFNAGGSLGRQVIHLYDANKKLIDSISFDLDAKTNIDDGGYYKKMFDLFYKGMFADIKEGTFALSWNGKTYHVFVPWVLDNFHTMKGLKYFLPNGHELIDVMKQSQREDGMIYSFIQYMNNADYFLTRDKFSGYSKKIGDRIFVRQPVENHPEYIYVNTIYDVWKSSGDDEWMKSTIASATKALDYALIDPARWSKRFGLLKRAYTIDSWDFAVDDEYTPNIGITNTMIIDPNKTKFGVFFGDNTGYITACYQVAEMALHVGDEITAAKFKTRGDEVKDRLNKLAWNGNFFTHFIDEDSSVHRNLGVNEKTQIAQSNAYSLNRKISPEQSKAIIQTYVDLKNHLPVGSPGEWYAIYPPFRKGFAEHNQIWQYMNGGVGGHVAGELARGAYENGYENYGTDILSRLFELGKKYGDKISFAYTGMMLPPPPNPIYRTLDLSSYANMDNWNQGSKEALPWMSSKGGNDDLRELPAGIQNFSGIQFKIIDPEKNNRKSVIAVSNQKGFPSSVEVNVNDTASSVYLLHTSSKPASENIVGSVKFIYDDASSKLQYLIMGKHLTYWWFPELKTDYSGIAWYGKNGVSEGVGLSWCAIDNPQPQKKIAKIVLSASQNDDIYTIFAISLSNQSHYIPVSAVSYGGPDDWAAATAMAAMIEGLAGVRDKTTKYGYAIVSPRWTTTTSDSILTTVRYAASDGYVSYQFKNDESKKQISIQATGGGYKIDFHVLLPQNAQVTKVTNNNRTVSFTNERFEHSDYVNFSIALPSVCSIIIQYK
ncbi:MAG: hypothetical protein C5B52_15795 [Bacteroidetes bacterium]|nr:MAG: hypothetical protein C5B52_15795 [Bacteroidota bacterium]